MAPVGNDTGSTGNASANLFGNELDWSVALADTDTANTTSDGAGGNMSTAIRLPKKIVQSMTETFVGCYVDGGYPKPDIKLMIGSKELPAANQDEQTMHAGDIGFEVPTFKQRRTMNILFGWMHNARAVKCVSTIGRSDLDLTDSILLSVQGKILLMAFYPTARLNTAQQIALYTIHSTYNHARSRRLLMHRARRRYYNGGLR